jgi:hypothetical protein
LTGLKPMVNYATSTLDFTNQQEAARVLPQTPLVASYHTGWKGLTFTHYCHPPHQTVEHGLLQHSLVITDPKSCFTAERHLDGKFKHYAHGNGRVDVIPAFLSHWTNWDREVEFSVIAICPTLLVGVASPLENRTTQELMQRDIELIPQLAILLWERLRQRRSGHPTISSRTQAGNPNGLSVWQVVWGVIGNSTCGSFGAELCSQQTCAGVQS